MRVGRLLGQGVKSPRSPVTLKGALSRYLFNSLTLIEANYYLISVHGTKLK